MISSVLAYVLPLTPMLAGLALSVWRFRAHDPLLGLVFGLAGVLLTAVVIVRVYSTPKRP